MTWPFLPHYRVFFDYYYPDIIAPNGLATAYVEWTKSYLQDYENLRLGPIIPGKAWTQSLTSASGVGMYYGSVGEGYAIFRGGYHGVEGGIFNALLGHTTKFAHPYVGFRCAETLAPPTNTPAAVAFNANQQSLLTIPKGSTYTLSWSSAYANSCTLSWVPGAGETIAAGSTPVTPNITSSVPGGFIGTYVYVCKGANDWPVSKSVTIKAIPPATAFNANGQSALTIPKGGTYTLSWSSAYVSSCTLSWVPGAGETIAAGSMSVTPNISSSVSGGFIGTWTYSCIGTNGDTSSKSVTIHS